MVNVGMKIYETEIIPMLIKLTVKERNKEIDPWGYFYVAFNFNFLYSL